MCKIIISVPPANGYRQPFFALGLPIAHRQAQPTNNKNLEHSVPFLISHFSGSDDDEDLMDGNAYLWKE